MRTKKGVKKLNERLDNTNDGLYHTSNQFSHGGVIWNRELKKDKNNEYERSSHFSFNELEKF